MKAALPAVLATVLLAGTAHATAYIGLQEDGVNGGALTQVASGADFASWSGQFGQWFNIHNISVTDLGAKLVSTALDILGTAPRDLTIYVTSTDQIGLGPLLSSLTSNQLPAGGAVRLSTFVDAANGIFTMATQIGDHLFNAIGTDVDLAPGALAEPYSVTGVYRIHSAGGNLDAFLDTIKVDAAPVPEPASLGLLGAALFVFGMMRRRWGRADG